ncbi:hypothetical protein EZV62_000167 [Acer yangbiense]|uniref:Thiaminase-2/PQQC domain-containing protein n=1 Tax=Acer yangbiense TaxID=1000413 RepID=A0A5C7IR62_9ROSI|nr:hypothetical protein EZV62_000167 [Acer yangbiense]
MIDTWLKKHRLIISSVFANRDGTVNLSSFKTWLGQDYIFVRAFVSFVVSLLIKAWKESDDTGGDMEVLLGGMGVLNDEIRWFKNEASKWGVQLSDIVPQKANKDCCSRDRLADSLFDCILFLFFSSIVAYRASMSVSGLGQDYIFVRAFVSFVSSVLIKAWKGSDDSGGDIEVLSGGMAALNDEIQWFKNEASKWGVQLSDIVPQKANKDYCRFFESLMSSEVKYTMAITAFWAIEAVYQQSFAHCLEDGTKPPIPHLTYRQLAKDGAMMVSANHNSLVFVNRFIEALFFFNAYFDCLESCMKHNDSQRMIIESMFFGEGITNIVATEGEERKVRNVKLDVWRAFFTRYGMEEAEMSMSSLYQADLVMKKFDR